MTFQSSLWYWTRVKHGWGGGAGGEGRWGVGVAGPTWCIGPIRMWNPLKLFGASRNLFRGIGKARL